MTKKLFVNLPVKNLDKTVEFFTKLGFEFNPQFADKNATCMIINDSCYMMLLVEEFFKTFIDSVDREIADTKKNLEMIMAVGLESRAEVDEMVDKAIEAGAVIPKGPEDQGFMYQRSFLDLDGHAWEIFYMDQTAAQ